MDQVIVFSPSVFIKRTTYSWFKHLVALVQRLFLCQVLSHSETLTDVSRSHVPDKGAPGALQNRCDAGGAKHEAILSTDQVHVAYSALSYTYRYFGYIFSGMGASTIKQLAVDKKDRVVDFRSWEIWRFRLRNIQPLGKRRIGDSV